ncbi:MAG: zinc-dependent peptidase [Steroidobacteraceae bacterium]
MIRLLLPVLLVAAAVIAWLLLAPALAERRLRRAGEHGLSEADRMYLRQRMPAYAAMPGGLRSRLERLTATFMADKVFVGCGGLQVTHLMRLAVSAQACLLELGRGNLPFPDLRSVLLYPAGFVVNEPREDEWGVVTEGPEALSGQAWDTSRILLSWEDVNARSAATAYNVVVHEFAHYLHAETGGPGESLLQAELAHLRAAIDHGEDTLLDPYGAEDVVEFFAVASEAFFEAPASMADSHPRLYAGLRDFYGVDPAAWPEPAAAS